MKLGVFLVLLGDRKLDEALSYVQAAGVDCVEIGVGGYPGDAHVDAAACLADAGLRDALRTAVSSRDLEISALSCHGNPVHPQAGMAANYDRVFRDTVRLAAELGVETVVTFSGQPGDRDGGRTPNWVVQTWPPEFGELLEWQWTEKVGPYWADAAAFAQDLGVKVAIELHPGFIAYNTASFFRLRREAGSAGSNIYVNLDPSHLFWQGMDPLQCVEALGGAIAHVHAKDTALNARNVALNGVLDTASYTKPAERSWLFRTPGYGHDLLFWKQFVSQLRVVGYDGALSIEHEDALMSLDEGFRKSCRFMREVLMAEEPGAAWWA